MTYARSRRGKGQKREAQGSRPIAFADVVSALREVGLRDGDILVVHSSFAKLKPSGLAPAAINAELRAAVGERGTLVMPAIPKIDGEPDGLSKLEDEPYARIFTYDLADRRIVTGALPRALLDTCGARRSRHPGNPVVALGWEADLMVARNLEGEKPSPCGVGSAWHYAYERDALIVALGVDLVHSLTMIHVAEEAFEADWPVEGWYRDRLTRVVDGDFDEVVTTRERRHLWSQHYAERAFSRDLDVAGISRTLTVDGLEIHACRARSLVDFLRRHSRRAYPYVFPTGFPRKVDKA